MKILQLLFLLLLLGSCYSPIVFDEAYPKNAPALEAIPEYVQGVFMCESDSTIVTINDLGVYALSVNYFEESIDKINERETCTLIGNEIYFDEIKDCVPVEYISEDSIKGQFSTFDTLFHLNGKNVVKSYKGSVVLSSYVDNKEYILSLLSLDSYNNIYYRAINENSALEELAQITAMEQIGVDRNSEPIYKIKPTKAEFEKIFDREDIFIVCEYLIRVNLEEFPYFVY